MSIKNLFIIDFHIINNYTNNCLFKRKIAMEDIYNEAAIEEARKRTERLNSIRRNEEIKRVLNSQTFKDLDYPEDDNEIDEDNDLF